MVGQHKSFFLQEAELLAEAGLRAVTCSSVSQVCGVFPSSLDPAVGCQCQSGNEGVIY